MNDSTGNVSFASHVIRCQVGYQTVNNNDIESIYEVAIITSVVNSLTSVAAVLLNALVIAAIRSSPSLQSPSISLLCYLAVTDLLTGLVAQPLFVITNVSRIIGYYSVYCSASLGFVISFHILSSVSFMILTAVSVDRFLAIHLHLRYNELVTNSRIVIVVITFWILCSIDAVFLPVGLYQTHFIFFGVIITIGFVISFVAYWFIFKAIRNHEERIHAEQQLAVHLQGQSSAVDIKKHKKASRTVAFISALYLMSNAPYIGVLIANAMVQLGTTQISTIALRIAGNITFTVVLTNASLNPLLYMFRIRDIRRAVFSILRIVASE